DGARRLLALPAARYRLFAFDDDRGEIAPVAPDDIRSWTALAIPEARMDRLSAVPIRANA
ncbi:MAG TPA: hypothetical protein VFQ38_19920, partial [Longimicrobiales bacterium]|nr:hypothetical protein [Longimicrobiales bacterium]